MRGLVTFDILVDALLGDSTHTCDLINVNEWANMVTCGIHDFRLYVVTAIADLMIGVFGWV